ncbi:MAG TPA: DNA polymerase I [Firmicutes bacterium]|nr:DNA polymerase I [Bacillota bacterium]
MQKSLFLLDGNSLINRAFYALPPLTGKKGEPTNAVYGLTTMLLRLLDDYKPDQIMVAFDLSGPTFRHVQFEAYKAHRKGMPDELRSQIPLMKELLDKMGIPRLELQGWEADDLIGTAAKKAEQAGYRVFIVTGDRDSFQLISQQITVLFTKRGITDTEKLDPETLKASYGVTPEQVVDLKGLMGDSSDNIPGVPGVGEKTAKKLLETYGSLEGIYDHLEEIGGKLGERLREYKEQAFLSRELATIRCQAPVEIDLELRPPRDDEAVRAIFQELDFRSLLARLPKEEETAAAPAAPGGDWDLSWTPVHDGNWQEFCGQLRTLQRIFVSWASERKLLMVLLADRIWAVKGELLEQRLTELLPLLENVEVYATSGKELLHLIGPAGPVSIAFDLELALYCLDPEKRWDLAAAAHFCELPAVDIDEQAPEYPAAQLRLMQAAAPRIEKRLKDDGLWFLYSEIELPLARVLADMEAQGILVDRARLKVISRELQASLDQLTERIYSEAGEEFNINSPKQLGVILFEKLGLPVLKRTKSGPSTSAEVLEELSYHPLVAQVLEYRQVAKLKSTYTDALGDLISPVTKRLHTTFNQTVTATGRLSSTHPNLQNIPVRTEAGRRIREVFVAPEGSFLVSADYSQIELRLLAHLAQDQALLEAFRLGADIHVQTASEVFGVPQDQVTDDLRTAAKAINFGIVYGISSFGLAKGINLTQAQAQKYIDSYFQRYPKVKEFLDGAVEQGRRDGYVTTLFGRRRYLPNLKSKNFALRSFAARTAMNSPIQGSAADIIKLAMLRVHAALRDQELKSKLLLQVHDELVLEVPEAELDQVARLLKKEMEQVWELDVPLVVDVYYGRNWRDTEPYELKE